MYFDGFLFSCYIGTMRYFMTRGMMESLKASLIGWQVLGLCLRLAFFTMITPNFLYGVLIRIIRRCMSIRSLSVDLIDLIFGISRRSGVRKLANIEHVIKPLFSVRLRSSGLILSLQVVMDADMLVACFGSSQMFVQSLQERG